MRLRWQATDLGLMGIKGLIEGWNDRKLEEEDNINVRWSRKVWKHCTTC